MQTERQKQKAREEELAKLEEQAAQLELAESEGAIMAAEATASGWGGAAGFTGASLASAMGPTESIFLKCSFFLLVRIVEVIFESISCNFRLLLNVEARF